MTNNTNDQPDDGVSRRTVLKTVPVTTLGGTGSAAIATDIAAAHGPVQAYKNATQKLSKLMEQVGHPNEQAWFSQLKGHTQQANNAMAELAAQGHQFRVEDAGDGINIELNDPAQNRPAAFGSRVVGPFFVGYAAFKAVAITGAALTITKLATVTISQATMGAEMARTTSTGTAIPTPYPNMRTAVGSQALRNKWNDYMQCYTSHELADVVGDKSDIPKVEEAIDKYLQEVKQCPKSIDQIQDYIDSTVEFVDDFSTSPGAKFSFEQTSPGSPPANPWYVFNDGGFHRVSTDRATDGSQSCYMGGAELRDPSAIAVDIDLSDFPTVVYDIWAVSNNPDWGNIKVGVDQFAFAGGDNVDNVHARINTDGKGTGENQWHTDNVLNLSDYSGTHSVIFFVSGDNEVYWDNIRFKP